ncbi:SDR family NAD(P)-dependent oxidoreductase [Aureibacter tunicatorum]|uniref:NAD(P)-dependent dehydrogenase (Short-subunit alcohol dehydrogenase family) n=1 Tax=Aureibacter tunicatorum TaxID=866807 RepID=A0AAE3XR10_9BACT|nr:SDR family NAD(P)-dependent oxidoreductase [Aureibacter tunicatorum]MDR6241085.1 NAD(P)-dependent dehydrogenase (short-subunit alcohol dehydrogenase family) [Aureibacter tunicatorum]BDD03863.1 3-oxoacyl-ACP reductase [Aureibacter tunicatorum]
MKKEIRQKSFEGMDLKDKTVVFTGGTDGLGKAAVTKLAKMGATIMLLGRNKAKTKAVVSELSAISKKENIYYVHCDLASQKSIRKASEIILDKCPKINFLINCAGANVGTRQTSEEGFEMNWAINHLGPLLLTKLLLNRIKETHNSKIINLSSATSGWIKMNYDDLQFAENWSLLKSYGQAKLAMIMCTRRLAKELEGTGVTVNALNPGFIKTNLLNNGTKGLDRIIGVPYMFLFASKAEIGGDRILRLALSDEFENVSGKFIYEDHIKNPNAEALISSNIERVWKISKEHIGLK